MQYKKGRLAERRAGLIQLRQLILSHLPLLEPRLCPVDLPQVPLAGRTLKDLENRLDSLICAYVAAHWWYWGLKRNWVLGVSEMKSIQEIEVRDQEETGRKANRHSLQFPNSSSFYDQYPRLEDFRNSGYLIVPKPAY